MTNAKHGCSQVAIVTGGSGGLGGAVCLGLARKGMAIAIAYSSDRERAERLVAECVQEGVDAFCAQVDVSSGAECREAVAQAIDRWGRVDILINNAGRTRMKGINDLSAQDLLDIYAVNVIGAFQMARAASMPMKQQGYGAIVNNSSVAGLRGSGSSVAYAASKGALNTLTLALPCRTWPIAYPSTHSRIMHHQTPGPNR